MQALEKLKPPKRANDKPLRIPLSNVFRIGGVGTVPIGRVEAGSLKAGDTVRFAPSGLESKVIKIT